MTTATKTLVRGIYVPTITFFKDDEPQSLDLEAHKAHILWMAKAGIVGFLIQGSTAEAVALTNDEKNQVRSLLPSPSLINPVLPDH